MSSLHLYRRHQQRNRSRKKYQLKIALIAAVLLLLLSWIWFITFFFTLRNDNNKTKAISPVSIAKDHANQQLRVKKKKNQKKKSVNVLRDMLFKNAAVSNRDKKYQSIHQTPRDRITNLLLDRVGLTSNKRVYYNNKSEKKDDTSIKQSTQTALSSSEPYVQTSTNESLNNNIINNIDAFAAEDYLDTTTQMGDNDDDSLDTYFASDDDLIRGSGYKPWPDTNTEPKCNTPSFYRLYRPTCNELHSTVSGYEWLTEESSNASKHRSRYLAAGTYRQVFVLEHLDDEVVFKSMKRFKSGRTFEQRTAYNPQETEKNWDLYDDMRKDSMVMELLSSSKRIADIYSFCGLSSIIEYSPDQIEKEVMTTSGRNNIDQPIKKIEMAIELSKVVATIHGHKDGLICTADIQVGQFCRGRDGFIKMLDFNRAEVLLYDESYGEYCRFENGVPPDGSLRAPEEIIDAPLTEAIDVYSLGNVFYSILTGGYVNDDYSVSKAHQRLRQGKTEHLDASIYERSPAEFAIMKATQWMWTFDAVERPSIFDVLKFLEDELKTNYYSGEETYR